MKTLFEVIKKPILTEKSSALKAEANKIVLKVATDANKVEIKKAVEGLFEVKVTGVQTMSYRGKLKRVGKSIGRRKNWKKAVITLEDGADLDVFGLDLGVPPGEGAE